MERTKEKKEGRNDGGKTEQKDEKEKEKKETEIDEKGDGKREK